MTAWVDILNIHVKKYSSVWLNYYFDQGPSNGSLFRGSIFSLDLL